MADIKSLIDKFNIFRTKDSILNDVAKDNGQITIDIKQPFSDDIDSNNSLKTKLETNIKDKLFNTEINNVGSNVFDEKIKPFDKGYNVSNTPDTDTKTPIDTTPIKPDTPTIEKNTADATAIQQEKIQQPEITTPKPKQTQQYKPITEQQKPKLTTDSLGNPMPTNLPKKGTGWSGVGQQQIDDVFNLIKNDEEKFNMFQTYLSEAYNQLKSANLNNEENIIYVPFSYDHENGNMQGITLRFGLGQKEWAEKQLKTLEKGITDKQNEEWLSNLELPEPETTMDKITSNPWGKLLSFMQPPTDGMDTESARILESGQKENRLNAIKWGLIENIKECQKILDKYYKDKSQIGTALSQKNIAETINNVIFPQIDLVKQSEIASIISKYKKNPKSLTPIENEIVKYYSDYVNALSVVANKTSTGYETTKAIETSLPFMVDFLRFNFVGSATRGGTRAAMKIGGKGLARQIAKDTPKTIGARAFKLGEDILTAAGHTSVSPLTHQNMLEDYSQTMATNGQYTKNDLIRGGIEAFTENFSERMFGALKGIVPKSNNAFVNSLFGNNPVIKSMQKHMNVGGLFEENAEEYAGAFLNTMFGFALNDEKLKSSFKEQLDNSVPTILSIGITVGLPQAIGMGIDFREIRNTNKRFNVAENNLKQYFNKENSYLDINRYSDGLKSLYINLNNAKNEEDKAEIKGKIAELNKTAANLAMEKGDSDGFNLISEYSIAAQNSFYVTNKAMSELKNMSEEDRTKLSDNAINKLKNDFTNNLNWSLISRAAAKNITDQNGKQHPTCFLYTDNGVTYVLNGQKDNMFYFVDVNGNTISKSADELRNNENLSVLHLNNLLSFGNKELEDINSKFIDIAQYNAGYRYKVNDNGEIRYYTDNKDLINSNTPYEEINRDKIESNLVGSYDLVRIDNITNAVEDMANAFTEPAAEQTDTEQPAAEQTSTEQQPAQEQPQETAQETAQETIEQPAEELIQEQQQEQTTQEPAQEQPIQEQTTEEQETTEQEPIQPTQQEIEPTQEEDDSTALNEQDNTESQSNEPTTNELDKKSDISVQEQVQSEEVSAFDKVKNIIIATAQRKERDINTNGFAHLLRSLSDEELNEALEFVNTKKGRSKIDKIDIDNLRRHIYYELEERDLSKNLEEAENRGYEYSLKSFENLPADFDYAGYIINQELQAENSEKRGYKGMAAFKRGLIRAVKKLQEQATRERTEDGERTTDSAGSIEAESRIAQNEKENTESQGKKPNIPQTEEAALRDALIDKLREAGIDVITDVEEAQRVLDEANGKDVRQQKTTIDAVIEARDKEYLEAVRNGDLDKAQRMVVEAAKLKGYNSGSQYQGTSAFNGAAPWGNGYFLTKEERKEAWDNDEYDGDQTLGDYIHRGIDAMNLDFIALDPRNYRAADPMRKEAIDNVRNAIQKKSETITMYRSVPSDVKEGSFRNGDWVTPSRAYAVENAKVHGWGDNFNIIEQKVPVDEIWWDGNDIAEWGYGREEDFVNDKDFAYKNTKNNRKLLDAVTYDDNGNVIPLSKRFNARKSDIRFLRTADGNAYGFTVGGKIYIDPRIATADTPIHEYAHLWASAMQKLNPNEWANIVKLMKGTPIWEEVKRNYPELTTDNEIADEVLAFYSGSRGAERLREEHTKILKGNGNVIEKVKAINAIKRVREALKRFWKNVADWFGIHFTTAEEVADNVLSDLLNGVNPTLAGIEDDIRYSKYFGGNSGYVGYSMSKRAAQAREEGRYPKTDFKKNYGITDKSFNALVNFGYIDNSEWHHTSKFGNKTTFYEWENEEAYDAYKRNKKEIDALTKEYDKLSKDVETEQWEMLAENTPIKGYELNANRDWHVRNSIENIFREKAYKQLQDEGKDPTNEEDFNARVEELKNTEEGKKYEELLNRREELKKAKQEREKKAESIKADIEKLMDTKDITDEQVKTERVKKGDIVQIVAFEPTQIKSATDNVGTFDKNNPDIRYQFVGEKGAAEVDTETIDANSKSDTLYRIVDDKSTIERLDAEPKIKAYRAMQVIDGRLYSPMAAKIDGKLSSDNPFDTWTEAEETVFDFTPEQISAMEELDNSSKIGEVQIIKGKLRYRKDSKTGKGKLQFHLVKGDGTDLWAAYNPYIHNSLMMLNDQFTSAYKRPNIVVVEVEIPESELTSGYRANFAKDAVGIAEWKAGPVASQLPSEMSRKVILSRWSKVKRIVPYSEVADNVAALFSTAEQKNGKKMRLPIDSFHPELRKELEKRGFEFEYGTYTKEKTDKKGNLIKAWDEKTEEEKQQDYNGAAYIDDAAIKQLNEEFGGKWIRREGVSTNDELSQSERQRMAERVNELADKLQLDNVEVVTDASTLEGNKKRAKGFYSKSTDKITIVIPNNSSVFDVEQTLLHEAVAHYGLRQMFGEHFDTFIDNVFNNADKAIRKRIIAIASKNGFDLRTATEEYLATLAENTEFEAAQKSGWWQKIKDLFLNMLHRIGFEDFGRVTLTDNELRYILWRSYENLANGNNSILGDATDDAKQKELGVGNYADTNKNSTTTNENDIRYRRASNRSVISSRFERQAEIQREEKNTKSAANIVLGNANVVLNDTDIFDEQYQNAIDNNLIDENVSPLIDSFGITWGYQLKNGVIVINKDVFVSDILDKRVKDNLSLLISSLMKTNKTFFKEGISLFKKLPIWVLYKNDTKSNEDTIKEIINDILLGNTSIDTNKLELLKQYTVQDMNDILDNATKWFEKFEDISSNMFAGNSISDILDTTLGDLMPKEITTTQEGKRLNWFSKLGIDIRSKLFDSLDWFRVVSDKTKDKTASELYDAMIVHTKRVQGKIDIFDKEYVRPIIDTIQSMLGKDFGNSTLSLDLIQEYFAIKSLLGRTASLYKEKFEAYLTNPESKKPPMFDEFKQIYDEITEDEIRQRINEMGEKSSMSILRQVDEDYLMEEVRRTLAAEMFVKQYVYSSANTLNQGLQGEQSLGLINEVTNQPYSELYQLLYSDEQSSQTMHSPTEIIEQADILIDRAGLREEFDFIGNQIQAILNYVNIERFENGLMSSDTFAKRQLMKDFVNQRGENSSEGNLYEITAKQKANEKMKGKDWFNPNSITSIIAVAQTEIATMEKELLAQRLSYFLTNPNNFDVLSQYGMIIDEKETLNEELSEEDRNYIMDKNIVLLYGDRHTDRNTKDQVDKKQIKILKRNDDGTFTKVTISFDNKFIGLEEFVKFVNNNFKYEELRGLSKAAAPFTAWFSRMYTILSPLFPTKNLFKDLMVTPWLPAKELNGKNSQYAIKNFYNAFNNLSFILKMSFTEKSFSKKGFENKLKARSQELFEYYLEYSKQHSIFSIEDQIGALSKENKTLQDIERALSAKENKFIKFTERALLIKFMQHYAELFENLHKFSAYVTLRKLGYGEERSAQIANNATLNYDRSGSIGRQLNAIIPFAKAALGGLYRTNYLLPKYNPKGFLQRVITLAVLGVMQGLMYDPDDDDISEFARKSGMVFGSFLYPLLPEELAIVRPVRALVIVMAGKKSPAYFKQELMESTIDLVPIASDALRGAFSYNPLTNKPEFDAGQLLANTDKMTAVYALAMLAFYINENKNSFGKNVLLNEETNTDKTRYGRTKQDYGLYDYIARLYNSILNGVDIDDREAMSNKIGKNGERLMTIAKEDVEFVINNYIPFGRLYAYTAEIIYDAVNDKRINKGHIPLIGGLFAQKSFGKNYYLVNNIKYELKDFTNDFSQSQIEDIKTNILDKAGIREGIRYKAIKDDNNVHQRRKDKAKRNMNDAFNLFILNINNVDKTDFTEDEQKFMLYSFLNSSIMKKALSIGEDTLNKHTAKRIEGKYDRYKKYNNENIDKNKEDMNEARKKFQKMLYDKSITEEEFNNKLNSLYEPMFEQIKLRAKFAGYSIE